MSDTSDHPDREYDDTQLDELEGAEPEMQAEASASKASLAKEHPNPDPSLDDKKDAV
jgi:hypothetical protein